MKQKTLQTQYNLIKEGKGNKEVFLKEAKRIFPNYIPNAATFNQAEVILSQKSIISETVWGVTTGRDEKPDWFAIFNDNMKTINEEVKEGDKLKMAYKGSRVHGKTGTVTNVIKEKDLVTVDFGNDDVLTYRGSRIKNGEILAEGKILNEEAKFKVIDKETGEVIDSNLPKKTALKLSAKKKGWTIKSNEESVNEAKAVEKKASKEVTDLEEKNFDYKDKKNIDNVYGEQFLKGYYCEMKNPKNEEKTVEELKSIVAKNLAKDQLHYVKAGQFGEEGVGYTDELPGLKASKSDQMEKVKLKESKESLKEYTDTNFSGQDTLMKLDEPSYEAEGAFEEFFPMGYASQDDAADALMAHDKSPIKARMGRYAPMFVHVQYHEFTDEAGEEYRVHQTQYYNSNFKDDPDFNPRVTVLTLTKLTDPDVRLGEIVVKTDEYIKDLKNLNIGDRVSESKESLKESNPFAKIKELERNIAKMQDKLETTSDTRQYNLYQAAIEVLRDQIKDLELEVVAEEVEVVTEAKKSKKETIESKLAEIDKASNVVALEAKINAIAEMIESKSQRLAMVNEDSDLAEMMDKAKIKAIQKEIKELEKRKSKMEKLYEKSCGKKYQQQEIVDETQIEEDRKAKEYVMSIEDEDEREEEKERMFGSDDEISEEKINNYE
tara:strand:+ start:1883 stop:3865 length:1983 start_codon:yes stop_codon:yes gene_type:complete